MFQRITKLSKTNSFLLFGARGTGKSTLVKDHLVGTNHISIDLLKIDERAALQENPDSLEARITPGLEWVLLDEVQRVPEVLDVVHRLIEERKIKFALTGSSARKLKAGGANLLAGRAFISELYPLTAIELGASFNLNDVLRWGTLPKIFQLTTEEDKRRFLQSYALTYLHEEIWEEHLIRKLAPFRKFLPVAAQSNGKIISYANIARDVGVDIKTVQQYFQILEDTLICFMLEPFHLSSRKRLAKNPKCFFFDIGVSRALTRNFAIEISPHTYEFGNLFEHFIIAEALRLSRSKSLGFEFSYLPLERDLEIDLVVDRPGDKTVFVEIKSTDVIREDHVKTLVQFAKEAPASASFLCISRDPHKKQFGPVTALPWQEGLKFLGL